MYEIEKYVIDKNIPIPLARRNSKYPFKDMEINDSFAIPVVNKKDTRKIQTRIVAAFYKIKGKKFTTRIIPDKKEVRVWRIK